MGKIQFFNLDLLESETRCESAYVVAAMKALVFRRNMNKTRYDEYKAIPELGAGRSYLLEPKKLLNSKSSDYHKAIYIRLAGRRNYMDYKTYGIKYLNLSLYPDLRRDLLSSNPLLRIEDNKLYFLLEGK